MNTGHTSKAALGAARIALLAGASVAAIFAAGSAYAQTPPGTFAPEIRQPVLWFGKLNGVYYRRHAGM